MLYGRISRKYHYNDNKNVCKWQTFMNIQHQNLCACLERASRSIGCAATSLKEKLPNSRV